MKNYLLIALSSLMFISCSKDEDSPSNASTLANKEVNVLEFSSNEMMYQKIDEIVLLKEQKQQKISNDFILRNNLKITSRNNKVQNDVKNKDAAILEDLKNYNNEKLNAIYEIRKILNFTSIMSIADEINTLVLINPTKGEDLFVKYGKFLKRNDYQQVETIFYNGLANVINLNGEVLINGQKLDIELSNSKTNSSGKFIGYEAVVSGTVAKSGNFTVIYQAGREVHKNDLGVRFFKYYCDLAALYRIDTGENGWRRYRLIPCPTTYTVDSGSKAGFAQTKNNFFSDYAFSYDYPSGYGEMVTNTGGNKNTPYVPVGGNVSGHFSTNTGGFYEEMTGGVIYHEED